MPSSREQQRRFRTRALELRRSVSDTERQTLSRKINVRFINSSLFFSASTIGVYIAANDEVDTNEVILRSWRAKKRVYAPVIGENGSMQFTEFTANSTLRRNRYGLFEPVGKATISPKRLDVALTPVVAFDSDGGRIGMGGGYYDRCFSFLQHREKWLRTKLVGLAFDVQGFEKLPRNPWDIKLYRVFSE